MKMLWQVISILAVLHILALVGLGGFLVASGRVDRARLVEAVGLFKPTLEEAKLAGETAAEVGVAATGQIERLKAVEMADAPQSAATVLAADRMRNEILLRQLERTRQEIKGLQDNLRLQQERLEKRHKKIVRDETDVKDRLNAIRGQLDEEGFQRAVTLYESLPPRQSKDHFLALMRQQKPEQIIAYLEAMEPRKAAAVLKEFKSDEEVAAAVELTERLRSRGENLLATPEPAG
ncbi:MAG: hypothetical protein OER86_13070 [Phycisphaerae bacterium]|nr:hypothetical protein [Phycisphaerae bacterium]